MTSLDFAPYLAQRPFRSIRLFVSDGSVHEVHRPDGILATLTSVLLPLFDDQFETVDMMHITRIQPIKRQPASTGNGA